MKERNTMPTRKKAESSGKGKIHKVMKEYKEGDLKSGSGGKVKSRKQAVAIALSEARSAGAKIPPPNHANS
jgi:hypothetical protein